MSAVRLAFIPMASSSALPQVQLAHAFLVAPVLQSPTAAPKGRCLSVFEATESLCIWRVPSWWRLCRGATAACDAALSGLNSLPRTPAALIQKATLIITGQKEAHKCNLTTMHH